MLEHFDTSELGRKALAYLATLAIVIAFLAAGIYGAQPTAPSPPDRPVVGSFADGALAIDLPVTGSIGTSPVAPERHGVAFLIGNHERFRYNVEMISVGNGGRVTVWRKRDGKRERMEFIDLPAPLPGHHVRRVAWSVPHRVEVPPDGGTGSPSMIEVFRTGDTCVLERSEGLLVAGRQYQWESPDVVHLPIVSAVDRVSNAPSEVLVVKDRWPVEPGDVP